MSDKPKSLSMVMTLYDDAKTRKWHTMMSKSEIMADDARNYEGDNECFSGQLEAFLEWSKTYRVTFEEVENE
jgi:hypothetical protein